MWAGSTLAATHADYYHAARDFQPVTVAGEPLMPGMAEHHVRTHMSMCPRCAAALASRQAADDAAGPAPTADYAGDGADYLSEDLAADDVDAARK